MKTNLSVSNNERLKVNGSAMLFFASGIPSTIPINMIGEVYAAELLLPLIAMLFALKGSAKTCFNSRTFTRFVFSLIALLIGYIISDLISETSSTNYLKGWGRNGLLISDVISLSIIASVHKKNLFWFIYGAAVGGLSYTYLSGTPFNAANWKLHYADPVFQTNLAIINFIPNLLGIVSTLSIGLFSFFMDSRAFSSICILVGMLLWLKRSESQKNIKNTQNLAKTMLFLIFGFSIIFFALSQTEDSFANRREVSSTGRFTAIKIGLIAIMDSPIIGTGSWGENTKEYAAMLYKENQSDMRRLGQSNYHQGNRFLAHSQILQGWMEGGILAGQFFIFYGLQLYSALKKAIFVRKPDYMTGLYYFLLITALWGLFMSPYSGVHRLQIALAIAITCAINIEQQTLNKSKNPS